jgi:hypothetical protein
MPNPENIVGHKFKPGQSGNPAGKPKGIEHSKTRLQRLLKLTEKMQNPVTGELEDFSVMEQIDMIMISQARKGNLKAVRELLDRLEGRPTVSVESTGEITHKYEDMTDEQLDAVIKARQDRLS